ncbi:MAG: ROK family protein [Opitutae bacterium]|nr:ROK family protein [Opitutae bacterium]
MDKKETEKQPPSWRDCTPSQKRVLLGIRRCGSCTREHLGTILGLPASSVSREVSPLLLEGTLISDPPGVRRRNAQLSVAPSLAYAIGVEVGFEKVRALAVNLRGEPVGVVKEYRPDRRDAPAFLQCVQKVVREILAQPYASRVLGIGVGFANRGLWNPAQAFAREREEGKGDPLVHALEQTFRLPVRSRSDAACAALGEHRSGKLRGVDNGLFVLYLEGIGLGVIAAGQVVYGEWNDAGELGHIPVDDDGDYCHCGNIGCLETVAAQWALVKRARQIMQGGGQVNFRRIPNLNSLQISDLCAMAATGDQLARNMLAKAGRALGRALAISASLFDPAAIILGGDLMDTKAYGPMIAAMRENFQTLTAHRTPQPIRFEVSALGNDATVFGAAELVFADLLA